MRFLLQSSALRQPVLLRARRCLFTSPVARVEPIAGVEKAEVVKPREPIGGFRGGIFGFLLGFSLAASYASYHLLEEYKLASALMQSSVEELQANTQKISAHVRRIEVVEKDLKALEAIAVPKEDLNRLRSEVKKLYDGLHVEFLDLRAHVWGMQQDLHKVLKQEATTTSTRI